MTMNELLETVRAALGGDASAETRTAGATACRTLLAALEATPGQPLVSTSAPTAVSPIANAIAMLRGVPVDQLLDIAINRLRAAVPAGETAPSVLRLNVPIIAIPRAGGKP
jgi:hypothetical protein